MKIVWPGIRICRIIRCKSVTTEVDTTKRVAEDYVRIKVVSRSCTRPEPDTVSTMPARDN
ncbi:MAG: hypothetical protein IPG58_19765 [Acidobacteria bacterium]|nr:hypothetical protein [Acidobacteriota bacterium]